VSVGGLDFSKGIIIEGALRKKRKNKLMKWRPKYFVLSRLYGALFFWTGSRDRCGAYLPSPLLSPLLSSTHTHTHTHS
jgi:hypothetical protein